MCSLKPTAFLCESFEALQGSFPKAVEIAEGEGRDLSRIVRKGETGFRLVTWIQIVNLQAGRCLYRNPLYEMFRS